MQSYENNLVIVVFSPRYFPRPGVRRLAKSSYLCNLITHSHCRYTYIMKQKENRPLTLYELNALVRGVVETTLPEGFWVEAELSEVRVVKGHCYMHLIQKDPFSATPVARAEARCWRGRWASLQPMFERITGQPVHAGMKVLLFVTASFHEAYGFAWVVTDIDPTYTLGDMARKRQEIIRQLKEEGVFDLQRSLRLPVFAQRIAVISSEGAAGYGDFCNELHHNAHGLHFSTTLFPAVMQGEQVEASVIAALDAIYASASRYDAVVIIRGGGATADLSGFDTLALAENVANFPLPVITGIGHDRDESVLDMVAFLRVKTPTAAATALVDNLVAVVAFLDGCQERLARQARLLMAAGQTQLERLTARLPALVALTATRQQARLDRLATDLAAAMRRQLTDGRLHLDRLQTALTPLVRQRLTSEHHRLDRLALRMQGVDPQRLLSRGYSITTTADGRIVRDAAQVQPGDVVLTRVEHGTFTSVVSAPFCDQESR